MIVSDPDILGGSPIIKGTRMLVEVIILYSSYGYSMDEIQEEYPYLTRDEIIECLNYNSISQEDDRPYSQEDYDKAKGQGLDLDDWNDYMRFYGLGEDGEEW